MKIIIILILSLILLSGCGNDNYIKDNRLYCNGEQTKFKVTIFDEDYVLSQSEIDNFCGVANKPSKEKKDYTRPYLNITYVEEEG